MAIKFSLLVGGTLLLNLAVSAQQAPQTLQDCRALQDSQARLACYDAVSQLQPVQETTVATPATPAVAPTPAPAAPAMVATAETAPVIAAPVQNESQRAQQHEQEFGMVRKVEEAKPVQIEVIVKSISYTPQKMMRITFTNGQRWEQSGNESLLLKPGHKCTLSKGLLSAYFLQGQNSTRKIRVKRLD